MPGSGDDPAGGYRALEYAVADGVAVITLNRTDALNAFDRPLKRELLKALRSAGRDASVRAIVLTGAGRAFSAGQDLREAFGGDNPTLAEELRRFYNPIILELRRLPKPVIAAINGVAAGAGASLAFACDIRIAAETASFVLAFGRVGLVPDNGATWFLPRLVGPARAAELMMTGEPLSAARAEELGLVNKVVSLDALQGEAMAMAGRLAQGAPIALALTKRALNRAQEATLEEALEYEASLQGIAGQSADHTEGVMAFMEKRSPRFTGK
jgi:2-(1,2-epoxy-1,2-dihydrophenyl)acetyl-CoA isomerase